MVQATNNVDLKIVLRDENDQLMDQYLTNGARSIPKLILIDSETGAVRGSWGPRPAGATQLVKEFKERHGAFTAEAKTELQKWYLQDRGLSTMEEIALLLETADNL